MIKLKSVIYLISMMTLAGCSGQKQASVAVEEQSGQWILGPFVRPEGVNPVISPQPTTFQCPMRKQPVRWEESDTFNPAATVKTERLWYSTARKTTRRKASERGHPALAMRKVRTE